MARKTDKAYDRAQSKQTRQAAKQLQTPGWGQEDRRVRTAYDRDLRRTMPVDKKGRRK
jgi:hypothetical protein